MRRTAGLVLAALIAVAVGCADDEKVTTERATSPPATTTPTSPSPTSETPSPTPSQSTSAAVGDTLDLTGVDDGEALAVTLVKVIDPARAENAYSSPDAGKRFVAVQFRLKNTGTAVYSDSPGNGARIVDTQGQQFDSTYEGTAAGPDFPGSITVAPGDSALGFITFEVPAASRIAKVQFAMNSGFSAHTGQWNVTTR
ncbi:DUF4352 domain-containing protein [Streptomyces sp. YU58]|uniref:DUF4352 domain-containing protein n=1 Tax=Streptomyces sp. SX92 TaxID=3158972 RepID=UPI0027B8A427|nr:DUF4352 domain-containing protein [Streptomyces coralus]WLW53895.1 DUF4352 domain-containing protein [Streptomyces coralus]